MCGISGFFNLDNKKAKAQVIANITDTLMHRGPDNGAFALIKQAALGHRRLSIIDLSDAANQPMKSHDERYTMVFNGEVYNFLEIRQELQNGGIEFSTQSDTEVVLKAYENWGNFCFSKFNGMFALAIYDSLTEELILARDQFGIKPLYYFINNDVFVFASEMKAIIAHPEVNLSLNKQGLVEYMWYGNPLGNNTFYYEIKEVGAGNYLRIADRKLFIESYFTLKDIKEISISEADAITEIRHLLDASVKRHLISDVPVGIFLSGGIDSSAITAFASKHYSGVLNTYSVGFDFAKGPNELQMANMVAKKFGTNHMEVHISGNDIQDNIEALVVSHDEPFGDAADIPLYLLTKKLKGEIKVVLQGDGGDEFFGGYSRYNTLAKSSNWKYYGWLGNVIEYSGTNDTKLRRLQRFLSAINTREPAVRNALLLTMESVHSNPLRIFNKEYNRQLNSFDPFKRYIEVYKSFPKDLDKTQAIFYSDTQIILKDTFFEKVDKATMANSIEVRVPFVDKDLTEFMLSIPATMKVKDGVQKYLLKKSLEGVVPNEILYGKKTGFSVPYGYWLQTSLADYFIDQISTKKLSSYLNTKEIRRMFDLHKLGKGNYGFLLWKTLIFAVWINKNKTFGEW